MAYNDEKQGSTEEKAAAFLKKLGKYWHNVLCYAKNSTDYKKWLEESDQSKAFYTGRGSLGVFYGANLEDLPDIIQSTPFKMKYNKVFEFIRTLTPELYYRNPTLTVNVRNSSAANGPQIEAVSNIIRDCVNYHYDELDFLRPRQQGIVNFLLSGRGPILTVPERLNDKTLVVREVAIPYTDFFIDPDAKSLADVTWMGHRHCLPKSALIKKIGKEVDRLYSSKSNPNELIEYYTFYTNLGPFGGLSDEYIDQEEFQRVREEWGDFVKLTIIMEPYYEPHADRSEAYSREGIGPRVLKVEKWDVPYWRDSDPNNRWPYTLIDCHYDPDSIFPISPVATSLGEARMVNWFATFLAVRQLNTTRAVVGLHPGVDEKTLEKLQNSMDMSFIQLPVDDTGKVNGAFSLLSMEPNNDSVIRGLQFWRDEFDLRSGLAEVKYMTDTQSRSAEDAAQKGRVANRTIDGLFSACEQAFTQLARKHVLAWRYLANKEDVAKIVGPERASAWEEYQKGTMEQMARDYQIQIIGDTMRRPNKQAKLEQATLVMETLMGIASNVGDLQAINEIIFNWQDELGVPDWKKVVISPPPPPPPPPEPAPAPPTVVMPPEAPVMAPPSPEGTVVDLSMPGGVL